MKNKLLLGIFVMFCLNAFLPLCNYALVGDENPEVLKVYMGEPKVVAVNNAYRVVVGNPNVADVANVNKNEVTINPKSLGTTTLVIWDGFGEQSYKVKVVIENMDVIKERVDAIIKDLDLPNVYTRAADEENKIMLLGAVKTAADKERIATALGTLKAKTVDLINIKEEETSIEIDVQVLEMNKDSTSTLGFSWPGNITVTEIGSPGIPGVGATTVTATAGGANPGSTESFTRTFTGSHLDKLFQISNYGRAAFTWSLDALVRDGKARILSRPRLTCQSGKEAEMFVGGEKPTFSTFTTQVNSGVQIEYKEFGIKLKVKPTVTEDNRIKLSVYVQVSEVGEAETIGTTTSITAKAYPLSKRNFTTELYLNDEQTLLIGGLIKQKEEDQVRKTPFFSDIPILGAMFRQTVKSTGGGAGNRGDTELFVTLTPAIVKAIKATAKKTTTSMPVADSKVQAEVSAPAMAIPENIRNYAAVVQRRILDNLIYPASAKQSGFEGTAKLKLHLSYLGQLLDVSVSSSSGYKVLDDNSVNVAKSVSSYPPFPPTIQQADLWVEVPVSYRLE
ncbi:MAG: TonB family protein [Candidatus Omnitrophica bacterium]|nr:TonB family protein [Candidatus Omnitrophota bacterium]